MFSLKNQSDVDIEMMMFTLKFRKREKWKAYILYDSFSEDEAKALGLIKEIYLWACQVLILTSNGLCCIELIRLMMTLKIGYIKLIDILI